MLFSRINRTDPEKVFIVVKNGYSTAAITIGQAVQFDFGTAKDGVTVTRPTARASNAGFAFAGIVADASIASSGYGLIQVYGYHSSVRMRNVTAGSPACVPGSPLGLNVAGSVFCVENLKTASNVIISYPQLFAMTSNASWTTKTIGAFIKAL